MLTFEPEPTRFDWPIHKVTCVAQWFVSAVPLFYFFYKHKTLGCAHFVVHERKVIDLVCDHDWDAANKLINLVPSYKGSGIQAPRVALLVLILDKRFVLNLILLAHFLLAHTQMSIPKYVSSRMSFVTFSPFAMKICFGSIPAG